MAVAVADSWYAEDTGDTPTAVAVSGFQAGDIAVVICFSFNTVTSCTLDPPTDNGGNAYTERVENTRTGTFRSICSLSDAVIVTPPTSVTFNVAGATGLGQSICVLRLTGATLFDDADENQVTGDDPTSDAVTVTTDGIAIAGITYDGDGISLAATGWTTAEEVETSAASPFSVVYKQTTAGSTSAAWTTGSSADYSLVIAAYKAAPVLFDEQWTSLANWSPADSNALAINSAAVWSNTADDYGGGYQTTTGSVSGDVEIIFQVVQIDETSSSPARIWWRYQDDPRTGPPGLAGVSGYDLLIYMFELRLEKIAGGFTTLGSDTSASIADGDWIRLTHVGALMTVYEGSSAAGPWTSLFTGSDSSLTTGWFGISVHDNGPVKIGRMIVSTVAAASGTWLPINVHANRQVW